MKAAAAVSKTPMVLALRDELTDKEVEVPLDAKGSPDFFVAGLKLRKLQDQTTPPQKEAPPDKKFLAAQAGLKAAKADYQKALKEYEAARGTYEKAQAATAKAKKDGAKPATIAKLEAAEKKAKERYLSKEGSLGAYRKGYEHSKAAYEKLVKARHRAPAYDYSTASYAAFGKKYPRQYGATLLVAVPAKPKAAATPAKPVAKSPVKAVAPQAKADKSKPVAKPPAPPAAKPIPAPPPKPAVVATPKVAAAPTPKAVETKAPVAPKPVGVTETIQPVSPGLSKEHPILYSQSEVKDGFIVIHTTDGKTVKFPKASSEYQSHGGGLGSIKTADGMVFWFRHVPPAEELGGDAAPQVSTKPEPPPKPTAPEPSPAKLETPVAKKEEAPAAPPTVSATPTYSGLSDAEAADYTVPVPGYPTEKAPIYVWKHKSREEFLAVGAGKRVKLNQAQFLSLDKGAHPELYAKGPKPLPKGPAPKPLTTPDF